MTPLFKKSLTFFVFSVIFLTAPEGLSMRYSNDMEAAENAEGIRGLFAICKTPDITYNVLETFARLDMVRLSFRAACAQQILYGHSQGYVSAAQATDASAFLSSISSRSAPQNPSRLRHVTSFSIPPLEYLPQAVASLPKAPVPIRPAAPKKPRKTVEPINVMDASTPVLSAPKQRSPLLDAVTMARAELEAPQKRKRSESPSGPEKSSKILER